MSLSLTEKKKPITPKISTLHGVQGQSKSTLLGLPPDLRNIIYELCLPGTCEVPNASASNRHGYYQGPALLLSCKQAYAEGINIFYHETAFRFSGGTSRMLAWLSHVASKGGHGAMLRSVVLVTGPMGRPDAIIPSYSPRRGIRRKGVNFLALGEYPVVKRATMSFGVLKLEYRPLSYSWVAQFRYERRLGDPQTWALTWDDSTKAKMVQC